MEVIQLSGYTLNEKLAIARQFLVPQAAQGARPRRPSRSASTDEALRTLIESYTREAGRAQPRARDRLDLPQDRAPGGHGGQGAVDGRGRAASWSASCLGKPRFRARTQERGVRGRRRHRPGLDRGRRRDPRDRGRPDAGQGQAHPHRQARRGDAGVGARRGLLPAQPRRPARHRPRVQRDARPPHPRARGRDPEGRPLGRHHHGDGAGLGADQGRRCARTWR